MVRVSYIYHHINHFLRVHIILAWSLLELSRNDPLELGRDEFTTIEGEEMGGGKKVAHTGETDFAVVYMHMPHGTQGPQDILIVYPADVADCITFYFQIKT